ncbi:keratin, type I cytoskeletal 19-like [Hyperolius riggenbachi]|uniref:keratin, type I cytoskeletal 19-like n=1 Tax=Hyperolius riggenbachi TaxID=752182 RepID=UPI0035A30A83
MSSKSTIRTSTGSIRGPAGGSSSMSSVRTSGSYRPGSTHGGNRVMSSAYGGLGSSCAGNFGFGLGGSGSYGSSISGFGTGVGQCTFQSYHTSGNENLLCTNEKETMQLLNDRLASYLDKVRSLEQENAQLERKIREWYDKQVPYASPDFQAYFKTIEDLQNQILQGNNNNSNLVLQIDNARLAADDFRTKYENEAALRMGVESDINGLRRVLDELQLTRKDLEVQLQNLNDELAFLKKNHDEEVTSLRSQLGAKVNVEVDAAPGVDLSRVLAEIRSQYETIMEDNAKEAERWFIEKSDELNLQVTNSSQQLQTYNTELLQLKHTIQNLEIDLQTQNSLKMALENTLAETEAGYGNQLAQLQDMINELEVQLADLRCDLERQNFEYKTLMDVKSLLEREIATYKQLMDGEDPHFHTLSLSYPWRTSQPSHKGHKKSVAIQNVMGHGKESASGEKDGKHRQSSAQGQPLRKRSSCGSEEWTRAERGVQSGSNRCDEARIAGVGFETSHQRPDRRNRLTQPRGQAIPEGCLLQRLDGIEKYILLISREIFLAVSKQSFHQIKNRICMENTMDAMVKHPP